MEQARQTEFTHTLGTRVVREYGLHEIVAFEANEKYVEAILNDGFRGLLNISLVKVEKDYADLFVRTHRGVLVRISEVTKVVRYRLTSNYDVFLDCSHVVPCSRRCVKALREVAKNNELKRIEEQSRESDTVSDEVLAEEIVCAFPT